MGDIDRSAPLDHNYDHSTEKMTPTAPPPKKSFMERVSDYLTPKTVAPKHVDPSTGQLSDDQDIVDKMSK